MKKILTVCVVMWVMVMANTASAIVVQGIGIDFVPIGNAGNAADPATGNLYGAVDYNYQMGKYEVTIGQWNSFVSAAGAPAGNPSYAYDGSSSTTGDLLPISEVSWYEAAQFVNYLTSGDKSQGAYLFNGNNTNPGDFLGIDRDSAISTDGSVYVMPT